MKSSYDTGVYKWDKNINKFVLVDGVLSKIVNNDIFGYSVDIDEKGEILKIRRCGSDDKDIGAGIWAW